MADKGAAITFHKSRDIQTALLAVCIVGLHSFSLFLLGYGFSGCFLFFTPVVMVVIVPIAALYLTFATIRYWNLFSVKQILLRIVLLTILTCTSLFYALLPGFLINFILMDLGMRLRVASTGGTEKIQLWAIEILEKSGGNTFGRTPSISEEAMSEQIRRIRANYIWVVPGDGDEKRHVSIIWGGGFHHWGILVGPPAFHTESNETQCVYRWRDGVYGYHEIQ